VQQAGKLAGFCEGVEDRLGVAGSGQVEQRGRALGCDRLLVILAGKLAKRTSDYFGAQVLPAIGEQDTLIIGVSG
jgi:hypothetical protein